MSRADAFGAYYRDFRAQLLHQTYAYCGNTEVAQRSVADAFVSAGHHWRKLEDGQDRDAWMRERAFRATGRAQNRARQPWYVSAKAVADDHRPVLGVLVRLDPTDRKLVILRYLVGLDLPGAGREAGVTDSAAEASLELSASKLAVAGVDATPAGLSRALEALRLDLVDEPVDRASRLRREGNRRRRSHLLLAGVSVLALAVGAGALTATQSPAQPSADDPTVTPEPAQPTEPAEEAFTSDDLAGVSDVRVLGGGSPWSIALTSSDFGDDQPVSECLAGPPTEKRADHYWVRRFSAGNGDDAPQALEALEVAPSEDVANLTYGELVTAIAGCHTASRQLLDYKTVDGVGDEASMFAFRYVDGDDVRDESVLLARSGMVVETWVVRPQASSIRSRLILRLAGQSIDAVCVAAEGGCSAAPFSSTSQPPPADDSANGFLETVDLPVLAGVEPAWAATPVGPVSKNPSATACDAADFTASGASAVNARSYVVPDAAKLPAVFGMTETVGAFPSLGAAKQFMSTVVKNVRNCEDRKLNLTVKRDDELHEGPANGQVWQIDAATSENVTLVFRVGLVRVGTTVAEVTFTPADSYDVDHAQYVTLVKRAAVRLQQD